MQIFILSATSDGPLHYLRMYDLEQMAFDCVQKWINDVGTEDTEDSSIPALVSDSSSNDS